MLIGIGVLKTQQSLCGIIGEANMWWFKRNTAQEECRWHLWWAWYPVTMTVTPDGDKRKVWLEWVQRRLYYERSGGDVMCYGEYRRLVCDGKAQIKGK